MTNVAAENRREGSSDAEWLPYDGRGRCCDRCGDFRLYGWREAELPRRQATFICGFCFRPMALERLARPLNLVTRPTQPLAAENLREAEAAAAAPHLFTGWEEAGV